MKGRNRRRMRRTTPQSRSAAARAPARLAPLALAPLALAGLALAAPAPAQPGDAEAGREKAALCAACHGPDGISANPLWPHLAGQQEAYLAKQIRDFRDGARQDISMQPFVADLSEQDIADLAAHFASLPARE